MKHVGKMKNNGARVAVVYRTLPGDPYNALVVGTNALDESYHNALISVIEDPSGQQANELADILAVRNFPDGSNMLVYLHTGGHLKKVPTSNVLITPSPNQSIQLDELNVLIAEQKGVTIDELAVSDGSPKKTDDVSKTTSVSVNAGEEVVEKTLDKVKEPEILTPAQLRSKADKLFKEAQLLRKQADEIDPPKRRVKKVTANID
jgi:hypothetical protein